MTGNIVGEMRFDLSMRSRSPIESLAWRVHTL